jgi:hypothetical protein
MSQKNSTARAVGAAIGGAAIAAFVGMGTAHAVVGDADGWEDLLGAPDTTGLAAGQGAANAAYDLELFDNNPGSAAAFDVAVDSFEHTGTEHAITQLVDSIDHNAFVVQFDPDFTGYLTGVDAGGYLVPDDFLGYLATDLDFFLLNPTGLDPALLGPLVESLLGFPTGV